MYYNLVGKMIKDREDNDSLVKEGETDRKYMSSINNKKIIDLKILSFKVLYSQLRISNIE